MLTGDLIRYKIKDNEITPRYITRRQAPHYFNICRKLIGLFQNSVGKPAHTLQTSLDGMEEKRIDFKILRGLAKLLEEKAEFRPVKEMDYALFRHRVFSIAQRHYPIVSKIDLIHRIDRAQVFSSIAAELNLSTEEIDDLFYADLPENQILVSFDNPYTPESLLKRYNLALAQGLLYHAQRLDIRLSGYYRVVMQYLKLSKLIHWIRPRDLGFEIIVDGPASLLMNTQRYGIRMANFLPGLLLAKEWSTVATIRSPQGLKQFILDQNSGLTSHYTDLPVFDSRIEEQFFKKFSRKNRKWMIEREGSLINLGDAVFIPDFTFRDADGRTAYLEIVGYWTETYLRKKIEKINRAGLKNLILAVNSQLNCSSDSFKGETIYYRTGIRIKDVLNSLEKQSMP